MLHAKSKPNLLLVITDQQRYDTLSCHGGAAQTPNLDALATRGADLRQHYAQSPTCTPSRCSLFSGRYPHTHQVRENDSRLAQHEVHFLKVLRQSGYWLAWHGKNHMIGDHELIANLERHSDYNGKEALTEAQKPYAELCHESKKRLELVGSYASAAFHDLPDEMTRTGMTAQDTITSLAEAPAERPWCVVTSFHDPHVPHLAPRRFQTTHPAEKMQIPPLPDGDIFAGKPARSRIKYQAQGSHKATDADKKHYLSVYHSMCSFIDEQFGKILSALHKRSDADHTIIVFISDHGDFAWHHGLCKKDLVLYEDLLHVPAIISWPGYIKPQVVDHTFTEHVDWMPTLLEMMGLEVPFGCQGKSFAPLLRGEKDYHRDATYAEVCHPWMRNPFESYESFHKAWAESQINGGPLAHTASFNIPGDYTLGFRTAEWSYNWYGDGFEELYHLQEDPEEWHNLAPGSAYTQTLQKMRLQLLEWTVRNADPRTPRIEQQQMRDFDHWVLPAHIPA